MYELRRLSVVATDVYCKLTPNVSSEKIWVWSVMDFAEGELKNEQFALKFGQVERECSSQSAFLSSAEGAASRPCRKRPECAAPCSEAKEFKEKFEEAAAINSKLFKTLSADSQKKKDGDESKKDQDKEKEGGKEEEKEKKDEAAEKKQTEATPKQEEAKSQ